MERRTGLEIVDTASIRPNQINPRGPNVRENDPHREELKQSIAEFGILVPLVVRPIDGGQYELIDGERRYWIAKSLKIPQVPVLIIDGRLDRGNVLQRMFQIHMNREQWDAVQQCKASEDLYTKLVSEHGNDVEALIDDFAKFTGTDRRTARNRVQFLRWPRDVKQRIYQDPQRHNSYWYVVEIEDKIVEPAQKNYPEYFERVDADEVRRFLYKKWDEKVVRAAVDVRQAGIIARSQIKNKTQRKRALRIFDKLVRQVDLGYVEAYDEFSNEFPDLVEPKLPRPRALINSIIRLSRVLSQYEPSYIEAYTKKVGSSLEELQGALHDLVESANRLLRRIKGERKLLTR